jgi:mono/diheme cytochrome c family protein
MQWFPSTIRACVAAALGATVSAAWVPQAGAQDAQPTARSISYGKEVYRTGNCIGCHKWHGNGGGGYGGLALSLRATTLDRNALVEIVRCGRPGTHMPYHDMKAWDEGRCFGGAKRADFDPKVFPSFGVSLTEREMQAVVDYVMVTLQGKGEPTKEECLAFWGATAERVCKPYESAPQ